MGAVAAIFALDGEPVSGLELELMTSVVQHRGPDGSDQWIGQNVGLAALLYTTTSEARGEKLPGHSQSGRYVISWDGRLDNRADVLAQLSDSPESTRSSDSEIVLAAFEQWGQDCLHKLAGDYAFVIWDSIERKLLCARDPLGARVLHYHFDGKRFVAATEINQILRLPGVSSVYDELMLGLYLCGNTRYGDRTFYKDIKRVPGGSTVTVSLGGGLEIHRFWKPEDWNEIRYRTESEYLEEFKEIFSKAVESRLRSAGPVAIQLSGGLDSSAVTSVAGVAARNAHVEVRAFHHVYRGNPQPESQYAKVSAASAGFPLTYLPVDNSWAMQPVAHQFDLAEPFIMHFEAMIRSTFQQVHENGCNVVLMGEGGDEAFSPGYFLYMRDWMAKGKLLKAWRDYRGGTDEYRRTARLMMRRSLLPGLRSLVRRGPHGAIPRWIQSEFTSKVGLSDELDRREAYSTKDSNYLQIEGFSPFSVGNELRAAETGVELRNPFWDNRIVEFMSMIPPTVRMQGGRHKLMLKKALRDVMPEELINRQPQGSFGPLLERGFREIEVGRLENLLESSELERMGVINASCVLRRYRAYRAGDISQFRSLFWTLVTEEWLQAKA